MELSRDRGKEHHVSDERILGREGFIRRVLKGAEMRARERRKSVRSGLNPQKVLERAAKVAGVSPADLKGWGRKRRQSEGRALFCKWMVEDLGYSGARVAGILGVTKMAVWKAVGRGRELEAGKRGAAS